MRIEDLDSERITKLTDGQLYSMRLRFIQIWDRWFTKGTLRLNAAGGLDRGELLSKYQELASEMGSRNLKFKRHHSIDRAASKAKMFLGIDVPSLPTKIISEGFVSLGKGFVEDPKGAKIIKVIVKGDKSAALEKYIANILDGMGKPLEFSFGEPEETHAMVYDLALIPRPEMAIVKIKGGTVPASSQKVKKAEANFGFEIMKVDEDKHLIGGVIYAPDEVDSQGDYTDAEEIYKAMEYFMINSQKIKVMHKGRQIRAAVIETYQVPIDLDLYGREIKKGTWWMTVKVLAEPDVWNDVKSGRFGGFSMGGRAMVAEE